MPQISDNIIIYNKNDMTNIKRRNETEENTKGQHQIFKLIFRRD